MARNKCRLTRISTSTGISTSAVIGGRRAHRSMLEYLITIHLLHVQKPSTTLYYCFAFACIKMVVSSFTNHRKEGLREMGATVMKEATFPGFLSKDKGRHILLEFCFYWTIVSPADTICFDIFFLCSTLALSNNTALSTLSEQTSSNFIGKAKNWLTYGACWDGGRALEHHVTTTNCKLNITLHHAQIPAC